MLYAWSKLSDATEWNIPRPKGPREGYSSYFCNMREKQKPAILVLSKKNKDVRSIDIARELNYSKPSVSRAIGLLKKDEYIIVDSKGYIELTEKGTKVATTIYDRHDTLSSFFESIGVCHDTAVNDACRIEHVISDETMNKIKEHMKQK